MCNRVYKLLHLNQHAWRKKLHRFLPGLWILPCMTSQGFSAFSVCPTGWERCRWPAELERFYTLSSSCFCRLQWLSKVLRLPKSNSSGSELWVRAAEECCCEGVPEKAGMHQLFYFLCVCGVIPVISMILFHKYIQSLEDVSERAIDAFKLLATHAI